MGYIGLKEIDWWGPHYKGLAVNAEAPGVTRDRRPNDRGRRDSLENQPA